MTQTEVHQRPAMAGKQTGTYLGVEAASNFGDSAHELRTLATGCGVFDLGWRAIIHATGQDRVRWLHNMVTNSVRDLATGRGNYNFVLNAQGRIQGDLYIFNRGETLLLETDRRQLQALLPTMRRFIIMDKVELVQRDDATGVGLCGPKAEEILASIGIDVRRMEPLEIRDVMISETSASLIRGPENKPGWFEFWLNPEQTASLWERLSTSAAQPVGTEALEMWRVTHGIPQYGQDIRDRDLPQETEQMQALHFNKGCYIGQEIVERIRSRGQVHRKFTGFEFQAGTPALGKYDAGGRNVAEITTAITVPAAAGPRNIGLGYVRREAVARGCAGGLKRAQGKSY